MMNRLILASLACLTSACVSPPDTARDAPPVMTEPRQIILTGTVTRDDYPSYIERTFTVPPGAARLSLSYAYTSKGDGVTLDLGLRDPDGLRGWSGSNKSGLVLSAWEATPSFRAGQIIPGDWTVILGVPAVREGKTSDYTVTIDLDDRLTIDDFPAAPVTAGAGDALVVRGDFHTHTGHSDGSCAAGDGARHPCPTSQTVSAARDAGLGFIAITDHNTLSQLSDMRALASDAPGMTLIPGTEITTFHGHANVFGLLEPLDFQLGSDRLPGLTGLLDEVERRGALISVNHPALPTGAACMGCGWDAVTDWSRIDAIEVINGGLLREGAEEGPWSGVLFWENLLDQGYRLTAIGGSDNHDPVDTTGGQSPIGAPQTAVRAASRSVRDILDGVRSGDVFIDMGHSTDRVFRLEFEQDGQTVAMGGKLRLAEGESIAGSLITTASAGLAIELVAHGVEVGSVQAMVSGANAITITGTGGPGWFRVNLRDPESGKLIVLGNPIYVDPEA